jgi:hypothetical protein
MMEYARLRPGPDFDPLHAALYYAQRMAGRRWMREGVAATIARAVSMRHPAPGIDDSREGLNTLIRDGLAALPELVPQEAVNDIRDYLEDKKVYLRDHREVRLSEVPSTAASADYSLRTVLSCPAIMTLINAPRILNLVGAYLGCSPTISSVGLRWSFPCSGDIPDVQHFHRDPDDWRFVKLFVYLTDVDSGSGPHVYVKGSHRAPRTIRARHYNRSQIEARYGATSITPILGSSGTAFIADTYGIHMGEPPSGRPRLMLAAQYSLLPIYAFRYRPLALEPKPMVDPYVNRLLIV